ncbi:MAG: hypothetical protein ACTSRB_17485 [Candidatus Helarchaeota archaeon]
MEFARRRLGDGSHRDVSSRISGLREGIAGIPYRDRRRFAAVK